MGQSIYATKYFPETRADLAKYPTLTWLDSSLKYLSKEYGFFNLKRYVLGLSTGARGVVLLCEKTGKYFHAAAALSGDYNQSALPTDPLCTLVYGPYSKFSNRWITVDNPQTSRESMRTPIYLGHGQMDRVVTVRQTLEFGQRLTESHPRLDVKVHIDTKAAHTFGYWRSELPAVWGFLERH
jgi:predicted esterase